jgi:hypothetical protein
MKLRRTHLDKRPVLSEKSILLELSDGELRKSVMEKIEFDPLLQFTKWRKK